jgi:protein TonB
MTSRFIPSAIQLAPAEPGSHARTIGVTALVIAAHLALLAVYTASQPSGSPGMRQAHAVAPAGPLEVVLLAARAADDRRAPTGPLFHAPIRPHLSPANRRALSREPTPTEAVAPPANAAAPREVVVAEQPTAAVGSAATAATAAISASATAAKTHPAAEAARFSARPDTKRADEVACRIPAPVYPARARRLEEEGAATVRMTLDAAGRPTAVTLEQGSGFADLDAAALDAVSRAACEPYRERGEAVPVSVVQSIDFKLTRP